MSRLRIRPYEPGRDDQAVVRLLRTTLTRRLVPWELSFWRWKHLDNPFGVSPGLLAEHAGRIVAIRIFVRWNLVTSGARRPAVRAVDTAVHPEYRRRGLFSRLTRELLHRVSDEGAQLVFNTPNRTSRKGYRKLGWRTVGRAPLLIRPLRPTRLLTGALRPSGALRGRRASRRSGPAVDRPLDFPSLPRVHRALEGSRLASYLPGLSDDEERYHTERSVEYLRWRYAAIPELRYHTVGSPEDGVVLIVRGRWRRGLREVALAELLVHADLPRHEGRPILRGLLERLARETDADYVAAVAAAGTPERPLLRRAGFVPLPWVGPVLTVRPLARDPETDPETATCSRAGSWRLSLGDLEIF